MAGHEYINARDAATLWTVDGDAVRLSDSNSQALSVRLLDSDAYVLGVEGGSPVLWKNDKVLEYIDLSGVAKSIFLR